ncbi:MAG: hypothetical protein AAF721_07360 [Myxococcota bacterium]
MAENIEIATHGGRGGLHALGSRVPISDGIRSCWALVRRSWVGQRPDRARPDPQPLDLSEIMADLQHGR